MPRVPKGHAVDWFGAGGSNVSKSGEVYNGGPWVAGPMGEYKKSYEPGSFGGDMSNDELRKFRDKARRNSSIGKPLGANVSMAQIVNTERVRFAEAEMRARGMSF